MWSYIFFQAKHCRPGRAALCGCKSGGEIIVKLGVKLELKGIKLGDIKKVLEEGQISPGQILHGQTSL